ncbi:signal recognition particle 9 kDa protein-like [Convolutriloba macropyga]|uniref:signal recognition particle 9 kDa protein-like n=1 Tax=Convolutriloba macropyga TaxID=536237 RepID=UPI003F51BDBB
MPVVSNMEEFMEAVEDFFSENPERTRVTMKYRHCDAKLTLKVTDDYKVAQYKTGNLMDVKKVEKMASQTIRAMATK